MEKIFQPKIVWINPNDIHGVEKRGEDLKQLNLLTNVIKCV